MSQPVRVVAQHAPNLFAIVGLFDPDGLPSSTEFDGETYYRAESHDHWILYKRAVTGWGKTGLTPDARQQ